MTAAVTSAESYELWEAYRELFAATKKDRFALFHRHSDVSISLQAAWKNVIGTLIDKELHEGERPHDIQSVHGLRRRAHWYGNTEVLGRSWHSGAGQGKAEQVPQCRPGVRVRTQRNTISVEDGHSTHQIANDSVLLPDSILEREKIDREKLWCRFSSVFTTNQCLMATHNDVGYPHNVACVDRRTGEAIWTSTACGCRIDGAFGERESWGTVSVQDNQVVIFGASWTGFYLHSFDSTTGKSWFRYSIVFSIQ